MHIWLFMIIMMMKWTVKMEDKAKTTSPTSLHHGVAQFMHLTVICLPVKRRRSAGLGVISVADVIRSGV